MKIYNLNKKAAKVSGISLAEKPHINSNKYRFEQIEKPTQEERKKHVELVKNELR